MGMAAILIMWAGPNNIKFLPALPDGWRWNLIQIGLVVSEKKSFENADDRLT